MIRLAAGIAVAVVAAVLVVVFVFVLGGDDEDDEATASPPETAKPRNVILADAVVVPLRSAELAFPASGVVAEVLVSDGSVVEAGQLLARLATDKEQAAIAKARADLGAAQAKLAQVRAAQTLEQAEEDRARPVALATARLALGDALAKLLHLSGADDVPEELAGRVALAEAERSAEIAGARRTVRDKQDALLDALGVDETPDVPSSAVSVESQLARERELAEARLGVVRAREALLGVLGESSTAELPRTSASVANERARELALADARVALVDAAAALDNARDVDGRISDAEERVEIASNDVGDARKELAAAQLIGDERVNAATRARDDAEAAYMAVHKEWLGIDLTEDERVQEPDALFQTWDVALESVFKRLSQPASVSFTVDDPATRWHEPTVFALVYFDPEFASVEVTCPVGEPLSAGRVCIEGEFRNAWEAVDGATDSLAAARADVAAKVGAAENAIVGAERELRVAQEALDDLGARQHSLDIASADARVASARAALDRLEAPPDPLAVASAEAELAAAEAALNLLEESPNSLSVAVAGAEMRAAEAALAALEEWPDPMRVAIAQTQVAATEAELRRLEEGPDPLKVAVREAELASAEEPTVSARAALAAVETAMLDRELRAPFAGTVVSTDITVGERLAAGTVAVRVADISRWRLETEDLDELSVVDIVDGALLIVTFDALPGVELAGSVTRISRFGEKREGFVAYTAEIELAEQDDRLRWNMTATIRKPTVEPAGAGSP